MKWHDWRPHRNRLVAWSKAIQGRDPYSIEFDTRCPSSYTDFKKRLMKVNPELFGKTAKEQFNFTKALLSHEAGHKRFTTPAKLPKLVAQVSNILEDERIERLMSADYSGISKQLKALNAEGLKLAEP